MNEYTICSRCNEKPAAICISCLTDCTDLKQQPPAGELKKEVDSFFDKMSVNSTWPEMLKNVRQLVRYLKEALANLDRAEAINKDLLEACEGLMEKADNGSADFDDPVPGSIYLKAIAAIAKAKKEG